MLPSDRCWAATLSARLLWRMTPISQRKANIIAAPLKEKTILSLSPLVEVLALAFSWTEVFIVDPSGPRARLAISACPMFRKPIRLSADMVALKKSSARLEFLEAGLPAARQAGKIPRQ